MNKIINKFLLAGDKFMPKTHGDERQPNERQLGFTYSACGIFIKNKVKLKNLKKQVIQDMVIKMN